jgi:hypothetical protein
VNIFKGDQVAMGIGGGVFYGNITGVCIKEVRRKTTLLNIKYDNGEEVTITQLMAQQNLYRKEHQYNTEAIKKLPARPPTPTTKKNTTKKKAASKTTIKKK